MCLALLKKTRNIKIKISHSHIFNISRPIVDLDISLKKKTMTTRHL